MFFPIPPFFSTATTQANFRAEAISVSVFKNFGGKRSETEINGGQSRSIKRSVNIHQLRTNLIGYHCFVVFLSSNMIGFQIKAKQTRSGARSKRQLNFDEVEVCRVERTFTFIANFLFGKVSL